MQNDRVNSALNNCASRGYISAGNSSVKMTPRVHRSSYTSLEELLISCEYYCNATALWKTLSRIYIHFNFFFEAAILVKLCLWLWSPALFQQNSSDNTLLKFMICYGNIKFRYYMYIYYVKKHFDMKKLLFVYVVLYLTFIRSLLFS